MQSVIGNIAASLNVLRQSEVKELIDAQSLRRTAQDDIFVALCLQQIARRLAEYHQERIKLLESTKTLEDFEKIDLFANWLAESGGRPVIANEWTLMDNISIFSLPTTTYAGANIIYRDWRARLPVLTTRLQQYPAAAALPEIVLQTDGADDGFTFTIQFATK